MGGVLRPAIFFMHRWHYDEKLQIIKVVSPPEKHLGIHEERFFTITKRLAVLGENGGDKQTDAQAQESNPAECKMNLQTCHD